jgi:hypothetical protein
MQSVMSHRQNFKGRIIAIGKSQLMQLDSRKHASGKSGTIQSGITHGAIATEFRLE